MPRYTFEDTKTDEILIVEMKMAELDEYKKNNPHLVQSFSPPRIVDPYSVGRYKPDRKFQETLKNIKKNNPGNDIITGNLIEV